MFRRVWLLQIAKVRHDPTERETDKRNYSTGNYKNSRSISGGLMCHLKHLDLKAIPSIVVKMSYYVVEDPTTDPSVCVSLAAAEDGENAACFIVLFFLVVFYCQDNDIDAGKTTRINDKSWGKTIRKKWDVGRVTWSATKTKRSHSDNMATGGSKQEAFLTDFLGLVG